MEILKFFTVLMLVFTSLTSIVFSIGLIVPIEKFISRQWIVDMMHSGILEWNKSRFSLGSIAVNYMVYTGMFWFIHDVIPLLLFVIMISSHLFLIITTMVRRLVFKS